MNQSYVRQELHAIQVRTRKFMGASALSHVLFFLFVSLIHSVTTGGERLVEISWIDPVDVLPAVPQTTSPLPNEILEKKSSDDLTKEHFVRESADAEVAPNPQLNNAIEDNLSKKLLSLQDAAVGKNVQIATVTQSSNIMKPSLAGIPAEQNISGRPTELTRNPSGGIEPTELKRKPVDASRPAIARIQTPDVEVAPKLAEADDKAARRTLAGALLTGPVADRPLLSYEIPQYPEWAKHEGVEGSSTIYFVVLPDGRIKESVFVQKTSGFEDFDSRAMKAILAWRFEPLRGNKTGEQWGTITFHFRLNSMGSNSR